MAWIELHEELLNHPKTAVLGASMGWNKFEAVGRLVAFWQWAMKYAPTGNLSGHNDAVLGVAVELNGEAATAFVRAMIAARWLDRTTGGLRIHDWPDYASRYLRDFRFKGRPDKWREMQAAFHDRGTPAAAVEAPDVTPDGLRGPLRSNSGVFPRTHQTHQPTNPPAPRARRSGEGGSRKERAQRMLDEEALSAS